MARARTIWVIAPLPSARPLPQPRLPRCARGAATGEPGRPAPERWRRPPAPPRPGRTARRWPAAHGPAAAAHGAADRGDQQTDADPDDRADLKPLLHPAGARRHILQDEGDRQRNPCSEAPARQVVPAQKQMHGQQNDEGEEPAHHHARPGDHGPAGRGGPQTAGRSGTPAAKPPPGRSGRASASPRRGSAWCR
uniref:Translation initiation factor IF-2-like n=1 Tax=Parastrongyloides trichosuri TaxID=131310 RepID=A0A0N5A082_PARTI